MNPTRQMVVHGVAIVAVLGAIAAIAPAPASSDRGIYERVGRELLIRDCADGHCFRPLVAGVLEHLPGASLVKWKAYAVIANAVAAVAVGQFCLLLGILPAAALAATWIAALGTGALYSLFDSYTSDPLMYMLGPVMAIALWQGRDARAGGLAAIGVFAKEFAAAPMWIFTVFAALERRWAAAVRLLLTATAVTLVWLLLQTTLMALQNYRYGATASADLLHGGFLATWLGSVGVSGALTYLFTSFGALYILAPAGFVRGGRDLRLLALAAIPAAAAFVYVEQPERALWNFHFIVIPLAAVVLQALPNWMLGLFVASFGVVNLRYGAQLPIRTPARAALLISLAIAAFAVVRAWKLHVTRGEREPAREAGSTSASTPGFVAVAETLVLLVLSAVLFDVRAHRQVEAQLGVNQWGYRGPVQSAAHTGVRIALVGGRDAFAPGTPWQATMPVQLAAAINKRRQWTAPGGPHATVDNLSEPTAAAESYIATLRDFEYLHPDIVCLYDGYDEPVGAAGASRRDSFIFRTTGYLPAWVSASEVVHAAPSTAAAASRMADPSCAGGSAAYCAAMTATVRFALQQGKAVVVAAPPDASRTHEVQQRSLADVMAREFGHDPRFRYTDLGRGVDPPQTIADRLAAGIVEVIPRRDVSE